MYNRVILIGRLVADPELSFTPSEKSVCKLRMAVDGAYAGQDGRKEAVFIIAEMVVITKVYNI